MILLDTSLLIDILTGPRRSELLWRRAVERGETIRLPALVLFEWWRGPRLREELAAQEFFFPASSALPYEAEDARISADIYRRISRRISRARSREIDVAIAATAIRREASLWTLNRKDFADVPGLSLWHPR